MTIKRFPEDFRVEELLAESVVRDIRSEGGRFVLYRLEKSRLTTPEAVTAVCRALSAPVSAASTAGLKDKHALTRQHLAVEVERLHQGVPERLKGRGWTIERLGWIEQPLEASVIAGNRFNITVRNLSRAASEAMDEAAEVLSSWQETGPDARPRSLRIVNYFGDQRFGSSRHMQGFPAKLLVKGDFEGALRLGIATEARKDVRKRKERVRMIVKHWGRWQELAGKLARGCPERGAVEALAGGGDFRAAFAALPYFFQRMTVQAYQSYLWNETARELVEECSDEESAMVTYEGRFGRMCFPEAETVSAELLELTLPVLGHNSELVQPWRSAARKVLTREGIGGTNELRIRGMRRPFFGEAPRRLFVEVQGFELSSSERDKSSGKGGRVVRQVSFELPRGAYATVVLRALGQ